MRLPELASALATLSLACAAPVSTEPERVRRRAGPCPDLAYAFFQLAEQRDAGVSRRRQRRVARESLDTPFVGDYDRALRDLLRVIDLVYDSEHLSPREIEESVVSRCREDAGGRAVLSGPWGWAPPAGAR